MNSTSINTDVFDPDNIDGTYRDDNTSSGNNNQQKDLPRKGKRKAGKTDSQPAPKKRPGRIVSFLTDRRTRLFIGLTLIFISCYFTLATVSYFSYGDIDQSAASSLTVNEMAQQGVQVENAAGPLGARLGNNMISEGFGVGSLVIIYYLFALGWRLLHRKRFNFIGMTLRCLIIMLTASIVVGYATYGMHSWVYWGGIHGYEVCKYLFATAGPVGPLVVSAILIGLIVAIYLNNIRLAYVRYRRMRIAHKLKVQARREALMAEKEYMETTFRNSDKEIEPEKEKETVADEENITEETAGMSFMADEFDSESEIDNSDEEPDAEPVLYENYESSDNESVGMTVNVGQIEEAKEIQTDVYDPTAELSHYHFPSVNLLADIPMKATSRKWRRTRSASQKR